VSDSDPGNVDRTFSGASENLTERSFKNSDSGRAKAALDPVVHRILGGRSPAAQLVGFEVPEAGSGKAVVTLNAGPQHLNPMGTMHGGILCDIADAAMGIAFASTLEPLESFTTIELKINFFRPVRDERLRVEGQVIQRGRTIGYAESTIFDQNGRLVAKANSTCLVLRGEKAAGR
jgi:uncharacterized protein (TIGR00369 family)